MVRKKARIKTLKFWRWLGCECSVGLLFFLTCTLATSFFIYLVGTTVSHSVVTVGWLTCEHEQLASSDNIESGPDKPDKDIKEGLKKWRPGLAWGHLDPKFYHLPNEKWIRYMRSLGLVSILDDKGSLLSRTATSTRSKLPDHCNGKCLSSSIISPLRQWTIFFRAATMLKTFWDRQFRFAPQRHCEFIINIENLQSFLDYRYPKSLTYSADSHIKLDFMDCDINIDGTALKALPVYSGIMQDLFMRRLLSAEEIRTILSRIFVTCGMKTSCLRANITLENPQPADVRRRLLSIDSNEVMQSESYSYPVALMSGLSSFLIILIAILCVCNKKTSTNDDPDIMLKQVTPRVDRRSTNLESSIVTVNNDRHSVHVTIEEKRKSAGPISISENGPYQLGHQRNDSRSSARGGTLDRRLPAIPMGDPTQPSCDDEIDDTYDTIAPTKVAAQNKADYDTRTDTSDSKTDEGSLRYEPVSMREEMYAEVTDAKQEPAKKRRVSPDGVKVEIEEMYEEVGKHAAGMSKEEKRLSQMQQDRINRESPYSHLPGDESELSGDGVIQQRPRSQIEPLPQNSLPRAQSDEVYEMYDTVADDSARNSRSFGSNEEQLFEDDNYASVDPPPPVPDRQYSLEEIASHSSGAQSPASPIRSTRNSVVLPPLVGPGAALPVPSDAAMSDPPYSQVTARESLASIRERQHQGMSPVIVNEYDMVDNVYEPVDDQPETNRSRAHTLPINDGACDWYSEIDCTATARHSDEDPVVMVPSPEEPRGRAYTVGSTPNNIDDLYTVVDKSKKTPRRPPEDLPVTVEIVTDDKNDVHPYAVVDKSKKRKNRINSEETAPPIASPENYNDPGMRPKIKAFTGVKDADEKTGRESLDSSGYQTVDEVKKIMDQSLEEADMSLKSPNGHLPNLLDAEAEPGYATVDDEEIDTTYDEITLENGSVKTQENGATSEAVQEKMFHMSDHKVPEDFWVRQEPVYSEVDEDDDSPTIIPVTVL